MITDKQWKSAKTRLDGLREAYILFEQLPTASTSVALQEVIEPALKRYNDGERSQTLYDEMIGIE